MVAKMNDGSDRAIVAERDLYFVLGVVESTLHRSRRKELRIHASIKIRFAMSDVLGLEARLLPSKVP